MSNQLAIFMDFENIALWAEQEFLDFGLTPLMSYLQQRGSVAIMRAYGDWSRFSRYREDLMNKLRKGAQFEAIIPALGNEKVQLVVRNIAPLADHPESAG